jgi:nucleoside-diphosphate-sugar epimerase
VLDLVQGLVKAGYYREAVGENFNLAAGRETKIIQLAKLVNRITNNQAGIVFKARRKWDTKPRLLASIKKAEKIISYRPIVDFADGLSANVEWFDDNWGLIERSADFPPGLSSAVRDAKEIV